MARPRRRDRWSRRRAHATKRKFTADQPAPPLSLNPATPEFAICCSKLSRRSATLSCDSHAPGTAVAAAANYFVGQPILFSVLGSLRSGLCGAPRRESGGTFSPENYVPAASADTALNCGGVRTLRHARFLEEEACSFEKGTGPDNRARGSQRFCSVGCSGLTGGREKRLHRLQSFHGSCTWLSQS